MQLSHLEEGQFMHGLHKLHRSANEVVIGVSSPAKRAKAFSREIVSLM